VFYIHNTLPTNRFTRKNLTSEEHFPKLSATEKLSATDKKLFTDKLKETIFVKTQETTLSPGWISITPTTKPIHTRTSSSSINGKWADYLTYLHEKRTKEYIENWGYDEWEKLYRFPNYDYEYFDKLDEKYEREMQKQEMNETNNDAGTYEDDVEYELVKYSV